jgi:hypothetical protein
VLVLVACGGPPGTGSGSSPQAPSSCKATPSAPPPSAGTSAACLADTRADTYAAGLWKAAPGSGAIVRLLESDPGPPAKGVNTWKLGLYDAECTPIDGASIQVTPYMPDHGHGTSVKAEVTPSGSGGYEVTPVYLFMPGLWQTTLSLSLPRTSTPSAVVFSFCIDG